MNNVTSPTTDCSRSSENSFGASLKDWITFLTYRCVYGLDTNAVEGIPSGTRHSNLALVSAVMISIKVVTKIPYLPSLISFFVTNPIKTQYCEFEKHLCVNFSSRHFRIVSSVMTKSLISFIFVSTSFLPVFAS